jgi:hypothetical protein
LVHFFFDNTHIHLCVDRHKPTFFTSPAEAAKKTRFKPKKESRRFLGFDDGNAGVARRRQKSPKTN